MVTYSYTRSVDSHGPDVDNPSRVDGNGNQIFLYTEILSQIAKNLTRIIGNGEDLDVIFTAELSTEEKTLLDTIITDHKNNA